MPRITMKSRFVLCTNLRCAEKRAGMETIMDFQSEYASVVYQKVENVVLLTWIKEAHLQAYREPTSKALELLQEHVGSNFVVDARNGFVDDKRDVEWGFEYLLPHMAMTTCRFICFIMHKENLIEDEMDMWTLEFGKYFAVTRADSYEGAISTTKNSLFADVKYTIKAGKREDFIDQVTEAGIVEASKKEPGNISYEVLLPKDNANVVCLNEMWTNEDAQKRHGKTPHYQLLTKLKKQYVENVSISCYDVMKR